MQLALRPSLFFCDVQGRPIFLDVEGDRYFCLARKAETAFRALASGEPAAVIDTTAIASLRSAGILASEEQGAPLTACPTHIAPASLLDEQQSTVSNRLLPGLFWTIARVERLLKRKGVAALLERLAHAKRSAVPACDDHHATLASIASAFDRTALFATTHDQCLPRSLALALYLAHRGIAPELVFAVKLQPFKAHCWVECGDRLVNDRLDTVRNFTPILRV